MDHTAFINHKQKGERLVCLFLRNIFIHHEIILLLRKNAQRPATRKARKQIIGQTRA